MRLYILCALLLVSAQGLLLTLFGQPLIAADGTIKLWEGIVLGPGNSQHLSDWYTPSHIIHGILFYWLLGLVFPRLPILARFCLALGIEVAWEVIENTPMVINHYRQQALAQGYVGDSVINSLSDSVAMMVGFVLAWRLPVWGSVLAVLGLEAFTMFCIRDGLLLNIVNLIYPLDFISRWQSGI